MIKHLKLDRPIYAETSHGRHFGRTGPNFTCEKTDMAAELRKAAALEQEKDDIGFICSACPEAENRDEKKKPGIHSGFFLSAPY